MTDKVQLIKQELERIEQILDNFNKTHNNTIDNGIVSAKKNICEQIKSFIDSLPEEPKFKVGDMVISTNNPSLTYKVLQVGLQNELGKLDYEVEIFNNGKPGIKVGNTFKEHNIHLICCDRMDEWGKLVSEEPASKDLEEFANKYGKDTFINECMENGVCDGNDLTDAVKAGAEWQKQQMMKNAVDAFVNTYENTDDSNYVEFVTEQSPYKFKETDKVKLIIIKED